MISALVYSRTTCQILCALFPSTHKPTQGKLKNRHAVLKYIKIMQKENQRQQPTCKPKKLQYPGHETSVFRP